MRGQVPGDCLEPPLEGAPVRVARVLGEQGPKALHIGGRLVQHGQQCVHLGQMSHNHDHQSLQEQAVCRPWADLGRASGLASECVDQQHQGYKDRRFAYHVVVSVLGSGNHMVRDRRTGLQTRRGLLFMTWYL